MISSWNFESHFIGTVGWNLVITITISLFRFVLMLQRIQCRSEKTWVLKPHWMLLLILIKMLWQFEIGIWGPNVLLNLICLDSSHQLLKIAMENLRPTMLLQTFDSSWNKLVAEIRQGHLLHRQGGVTSALWGSHQTATLSSFLSNHSSAFLSLPLLLLLLHQLPLKSDPLTALALYRQHMVGGGGVSHWSWAAGSWKVTSIKGTPITNSILLLFFLLLFFFIDLHLQRGSCEDLPLEWNIPRTRERQS